MKGAIMAAGGDLSLMPIETRHKSMQTTIEDLRAKNEAANLENERLSRLSASLQVWIVKRRKKEERKKEREKERKKERKRETEKRKGDDLM